MKLIVFVIFMPAVFFLTHDYSSSFRQKENVVILKGQIIRYRRISEAEMADAEKILQVIEYKVVHVYQRHLRWRENQGRTSRQHRKECRNWR